jgi:hypothetical protein
MANDRIEFGSVLDKGGGEWKVWAVVIPVVLAVFALAGFGAMQMSKTGALERQAELSSKQAEELQKTVEERDKMLVQARADESLQKSPGQAVALFYGVSPQAQESGVAFGHPGEKAARVYLYGLAAPPEGQEYVVAARTQGGEAKPLGAIVPSAEGTGFLLAKDLPEDTTAIELLFRKQGAESLDEAEPRVSARFPATENDRGVLVQGPRQARRGERSAAPSRASSGASGPVSAPVSAPVSSD